MNIRLYYILIAFMFFGCANTGPEIQEKERKVDTSYISMVRANLKDAAFDNHVVISKLLFFSSTDIPDTLQVTIGQGLIARSTSIFKIKNLKNDILYSERFNTSFLVEGIFLADTVVPLSDEREREYLMRHLLAKTKEDIKKKVLKEIDDIISEVDYRVDLDTSEVAGIAVIDGDLYAQKVKETHPRVIFVPCFTREECGRWIAYSEKTQKGVVIMKF